MQKEKRKFVEFSSLYVDYTKGDVEIFDNVTDLKSLYPLKDMTNLLVLCIDGRSEMRMTNKDTIHLTAGDMLFCPPGVSVAKSTNDSSFQCKAMLISDHILQCLLRDKADMWYRSVMNTQQAVVHLTPAEQDEFSFYYALIKSKVTLHEQKTPYEIVQALLRVLLLELCFLLLDEDSSFNEPKMSQGKILFNKFLNMLASNEVKRQPITYYASQLAITPKYLTMLCLKYSEKTASQWVIQYTIEDVRFYLRNSNLSIKEISAKMGFANMSHFGSYVRKHLGMSPTEFRDRE
ncbi:MAG: AraC family transcriptional regulator [Prevotella sp.]|nr:AraC family transcriptional regulator [Prevotella sp.]